MFKALLVGISDYKDEELKMDSPVKNVEKLAGFLVRYGHFSPEDITVKPNLTRLELLTELSAFENVATSSDNGFFLFFFSGHGQMLSYEFDLGGHVQHYLNPADVDRRNNDLKIATSVNTQMLINSINYKWPDHKRLIIIDACFSSNTKATEMSAQDEHRPLFMSNDPDTVLLTSSAKESQHFYEDEQGNRSDYSLFCHFFFKVVEEGLSDTAGTGYTNLREIEKKINEHLSKQIDHLYTLYGKDGKIRANYWNCCVRDMGKGSLATDIIFKTRYFYELPDYMKDIMECLEADKEKKLKKLNELLNKYSERDPSFYNSLKQTLDRLNKEHMGATTRALINELYRKTSKGEEEKAEKIFYDPAYGSVFNIIFYSVNNQYEENEIIDWVNRMNQTLIEEKEKFIQLFICREDHHIIESVNTDQVIPSFSVGLFDLCIVYFNGTAPVARNTVGNIAELLNQATADINELKIVLFLDELEACGKKVLLFKNAFRSISSTTEEELDAQKIINRVLQHAKAKPGELFLFYENETGSFDFENYSDVVFRICEEKRASPVESGQGEFHQLASSAELQVLDEYINWAVKTYELLEIRGVDDEIKSVPLNHVYVELKGDLTSAYEKNQELSFIQNQISKEVLLKGYPVSDDEYKNIIQEVLSQSPNLYIYDPLYKPAREPEVVNLAEAFQKERCLVILGDPGSGKTTLVTWLALHLAAAIQLKESSVSVRLNQVEHSGIEVGLNHKDDPDDDDPDDDHDEQGEDDKRRIKLGPVRLPVLLRIAEYAQELDKNKDLEIIDFLGYHTWMGQEPFPKSNSSGMDSPDVRKALLNGIIKHYIKSGQAVIFLDGLDEIPNFEDRHEIVTRVMKFINENLYPRRQSATGTHEEKIKISNFRNYYTGLPVDVGGNQIIITSRVAGYHEAPITNVEMSHLTIEPMQKEAIVHFCRVWYEAIINDKEDAAKKSDDLKKDLTDFNNVGILELASNPLLVTIIALVHRNFSHLPHNRAELYNRAYGIFIDDFFRKKKEDVSITASQLRLILIGIATQIHKDYPSGLIGEQELKRVVHDICHLHSITTDDSFFDDFKSGIGIIVARGSVLYGFIHLTFQEYLAGVGLAEEVKDASRKIIERLDDPRWREPILLALGYVRISWSDRDQERLYQELLDYQDPIGTLIPRMPLFILAAAKERMISSPRLIYRIIDKILYSYSLTIERMLSNSIEDPILAAFNDIFRGLDVEFVVNRFCELIDNSQVRVLFALTEIIRKKEWFFPNIIRSLIKNLHKDSKEGGWIINKTLQLAFSNVKEVRPPTDLAEPSKEKWNEHKRKNFDKYQELRKRYKIARQLYHEKLAEYNEKKSIENIRDIHIESLVFKNALEYNPEYFDRIRAEPFLYNVVCILYNPFLYYNALNSYNEHQDLIQFLTLPDLIRENELRNRRAYYVSNWGVDDIAYKIASSLDTRVNLYWEDIGLVMEVGAIYNESLLTPLILKLIENKITASGFITQLAGRYAGAASEEEKLDILMVMSVHEDVNELVNGFLDGDVTLQSKFGEKISLAVERFRDPVFRLYHNDDINLEQRLLILEGSLDPFSFRLFYSVICRIYTFYTDKPIGISGRWRTRQYEDQSEIQTDFFAQRMFGEGWSDDRKHDLDVCFDYLTDMGLSELLEMMAQIPLSASFEAIAHKIKWSPDINISLVENGAVNLIPIRAIDNILQYDPSNVDFSKRLALISDFLLKVADFANDNPDMFLELLIIDYKNHDFEFGLVFRETAEKMGLPKYSFDKKEIIARIEAIPSPYYRVRAFIRLAKYELQDRETLLIKALATALEIVEAFQKFEVLSYLKKELSFPDMTLEGLLDSIDHPLELVYAAIEFASVEGIEKALRHLTRAIPLLTREDDVFTVFRCLEKLFPGHPDVRALQSSNHILAGHELYQAWVNHQYSKIIHAVTAEQPGVLDDGVEMLPLFMLSCKLFELHDHFVAKSDSLEMLWRKLPDNAAEVSARIYKEGVRDGLSITRSVVNSIDMLLETGQKDVVMKLMPLLEMPAADARPGVTEWMDNEELKSMAILILRESKRDFTAEEIKDIMPLLKNSNDRILLRADLLVHSNIMGTRQFNQRILKASSLNSNILYELARQSIYWAGRDPVIVTRIRAYYDTLIFDDASLARELCASILSNDANAERSKNILISVNYISEEVADIFRKNFRHPDAEIQKAILVCLANCSYKSFSESYINACWQSLCDEIRTGSLVVSDELQAYSFLSEDLTYPLAVITDTANGLGPNRSLSELRNIAAKALKDTIPDIRTAITNYMIDSLPLIIAQQSYVRSDYLDKYVDVEEMVLDQPNLFHFLLDQVEEYFHKGQDQYEKIMNAGLMHFLLAAATVVKSNQASFNKYPRINELVAILKRIVKHDSRFVNRYGALVLLGYCRRMDIEIVDILVRSLYDDGDIRNAAEETIERIKNADEWIIDKLLKEFERSNGTMALNIAGILTSLGRSSRTSVEKRNEIMKFLSAQVLSSESRPIYKFIGTGWKTKDDELKIVYQGELQEKIYQLLLRLNGFGTN